jgi:holo-ACP synthase
VLANRERRARAQAEALAAHGLPLVSLTLVMPGPVKDSSDARRLLEEALAALEELLAARAWPFRQYAVRQAPTGPEALLAVDAPARDLKRALAALEDTHPLGRLWDLDVIAPDTGPVSRRSLDLPPRRCLACGEEAHACARSQAHPLPLLLGLIQDRINAHAVR